MQQISHSDIVNAAFIAMFLYFWLPPAWLLMRFLTPRNLVEHYFKAPHFTSAEITLFSHFPGSLMRTGIFMAGCLHPHRGKKRQMEDIRNHVPRWYITASRCFIYAFAIHGTIIVLLFAAGELYKKLYI